MLQGRGAQGTSEQERVAVVTEVWRLVGNREMPGTDLIGEDARASGVVFGATVGDVMASLRERIQALLSADDGFGMTLREAIPAPGGEVVAIGVARGGRSAWTIAVVNEVRDGRIVRATAYQDVAEALAAVGLQAQ